MLSASDIEFYKDHGYLVVHDVFPSAALDKLRRRAEEWVEESHGVTENDEVFDLEPDHSPQRPLVRRIKNPGTIDRVYVELMKSAPLLDVVASLVGDDIQLLNTKLNMKSAGFGSPVEWHQDWGFYPHTNDDLLAVGIPLDDMTLENGCLLVVPGSHKGPALDHHANGHFVGAVDPNQIDPAKAVALQAKAGSITIHHVRTLHGSAPNSSGQPRRLYLVSYGAADAWPLLGETWQEHESRIVRGNMSHEPRMVALPVRIPLPMTEHTGSIYELQADASDRRFQFETTSVGDNT